MKWFKRLILLLEALSVTITLLFFAFVVFMVMAWTFF